MNAHRLKLAITLLTLFTLSVYFTGCKDDDEPKTLPVVTTAAVTNITTTTANAGGEITSDGNTAITASGVVYSNTNNTPNTDDSKTETGITTGTFTSELTGLSSGTLYYIRAYATNEVGTAYGETVTFTTGNAAPTAINIAITGTIEVNKELTATYTYSDNEGDAESGTTFKWYIADTHGGAESVIDGATQATYTPPDAYEFKYIRVGITARAATGTTQGAEVKSSFAGPIAVRTTVTFVYNGQQVTYGIITSPVSGRKWLDRNLGAPNTPTAFNDYANYGDLFQWGRAADGHQLVARGATIAVSSTSGTTTEPSSSDSPSHDLFIRATTANPGDWRNPQNDNLWQGVNGTNNPCPAGFRIPTLDEWIAEGFTTTSTLQDAYTQIRLTAGGSRFGNNGNLETSTNSTGAYWSSSINPEMATRSRLFRLYSSATAVIGSSNIRTTGLLCKCIRD